MTPSVIRDVTSPQKILLALSRLPRGARFTSYGRINRPLNELKGDTLITRSAFLEVHAADGTVRGLAPQDLPALRETMLADDPPAFLIGFTADQLAKLPTNDPRPNLFAALEADEKMSTTPDYPPRFLTPRALHTHLHALRIRPLNPDDYAHRVPEIQSAFLLAPDAITACKIKKFLDSAVQYQSPEPKGQPEGKFWTTDPDFLGEMTTAMPREVLQCPEATLPEPLPEKAAMEIPLPPQQEPPGETVNDSQFSLPL